MTFKDFAEKNAHLWGVNKVILCAIGKWTTEGYVYNGINNGDMNTYFYLVNITGDRFNPTVYLKVPVEFFEKSIEEVQDIVNKLPKRKLLIKGDILDIKGLIEENA